MLLQFHYNKNLSTLCKVELLVGYSIVFCKSVYKQRENNRSVNNGSTLLKSVDCDFVIRWSIP